MITVNGIDLVARFGQVKGENSFIVREIGGRGPMRKYTSREFIPSMPGSHLTEIKLPERHIKVDFIIRSESLQDLRSKVDDLNGILNVNDPVPISFSDEPSMMYFGFPSWEVDWEELRIHGRGSITFVCADPYKYESIEQTASIPATVMNDGTAETYPTFEATINQNTTHFEIINGDKRVRMGSPASMEQTQIVREELVFHDTMQSTTSWQVATEVENGYVAGTMSAGEGGFYASEYGSVVTPESWQGPSLVKAIGTSLQDFRADIFVKQFNVGFETGMIEVYFLDVNNNVVAKIGVEDVWKDFAENQCKFQAGAFGSDHDIYTKADYPWAWDDYDGILRIERVGNVWTPYFAKINEDGKHTWRRRTLRYTDNANQYTNPITQVQVAIRKWPNTQETDQSVREIKIYRINEPASNSQTPYVLNAGDVIEVNNQNNLILRNGEPYLQLADLTTEFFPLAVGNNNLEIVPSGISTVNMKYRRRYL